MCGLMCFRGTVSHTRHSVMCGEREVRDVGETEERRQELSSLVRHMPRQRVSIVALCSE
jgi:hypothetical protein